jgi:hypothetical protein
MRLTYQVWYITYLPFHKLCMSRGTGQLHTESARMGPS